MKIVSKLQGNLTFAKLFVGFEIEHLSEPIQTAVFKKALSVLQQGEFIDLILKSFQKAADKKHLLTPN